MNTSDASFINFEKNIAYKKEVVISGQHCGKSHQNVINHLDFPVVKLVVFFAWRVKNYLNLF